MKGGIDDVVPINPHDIVSDCKVLKSKISNFFKRSTFLYNITPESNIKFTEKKEMITIKEALDYETKSLCQHLRKCIENSMEYMHTDVVV